MPHSPILKEDDALDQGQHHTAGAAAVAQEAEGQSSRESSSAVGGQGFAKTDWRAVQDEDEVLSDVIRWVLEGRIHRFDPKARGAWKRRIFARNLKNLEIRDHVLGMVKKHNDVVNFRILVPEDMKETVLQSLHDHGTAGHMGIRRTLDRVMERFYWPGAYGEVRDYCRSCVLCQRRSRPSPAAGAPLQT